MKQEGMLRKFRSKLLVLFQTICNERWITFLADTHGTFCQTQKSVYFRTQAVKIKDYAVILQTTSEVFMNEIWHEAIPGVSSQQRSPDRRATVHDAAARTARSIARTLTHPKQHAQAGSKKSGDQMINMH
jgi:hypothetical protein